MDYIRVIFFCLAQCDFQNLVVIKCVVCVEKCHVLGRRGAHASRSSVYQPHVLVEAKQPYSWVVFLHVQYDFGRPIRRTVVHAQYLDIFQRL